MKQPENRYVLACGELFVDDHYQLNALFSMAAFFTEEHARKVQQLAAHGTQNMKALHGKQLEVYELILQKKS